LVPRSITNIFNLGKYLYNSLRDRKPKYLMNIFSPFSPLTLNTSVAYFSNCFRLANALQLQFQNVERPHLDITRISAYFFKVNRRNSSPRDTYVFPYPPDLPPIYVECIDTAGEKGQGHEHGHGSLGY